MRRSLLALPVVAAVAATVTTANAASPPAATPPADAGRMAVVRLVVDLGHGSSLSLELRAAALSAGDVLRVVAERCDGAGSCALTPYQTGLPAGALTIDPTGDTAALTTRISGHAMSIRWRPDPSSGASIGGGEVSGDFTGATASNYVGNPTTATVTLDGRTCTTEGAVGSGLVVDTGTSTGKPETADLRDLEWDDGDSVHCA